MATLLQLRQALGHETDDLEVHTVANAAANSVAVAQWVDGSTGASALQYAGAYVYAQSSSGNAEGQQVQGRQSGFTPVTGTLATDPAWTPPVPGTLLEVTSRYPVLPAANSQQSYNQIVRRALAKMVGPRAVTVTLPANTQFVDISAFSWLDRPERLTRVRESSPVGGLGIDAGWRRVDLVFSGAHVTLLTVDSAPKVNLSLGLEVLAPLDTFVYTTASGAWAESTTGPVLDTDEVDVAVEDAMPFLLLEYYLPLVERARGVPVGQFAQAYTAALAACEASAFFDTTQRRAQPQQPAPQPQQGAA